MSRRDQLVIVRGGGDLATGTIHRLKNAGYAIIVLEIPKPSAIRRYVAFSEVVYEGKVTVDGMSAVLCTDVKEARKVSTSPDIAVLVDPKGLAIEQLKPWAVVDAIIAKKNLGTHKGMAPITVALGPGFVAGEDVDGVIETMRGHNLGKVITFGAAIPDTKTPGVIMGFSKERVIHAQADGVLHNVRAIADVVKTGDVIATIDGEAGSYPVVATMDGLLRGLIRDGFYVTKGFKIADIDPRLSEYDNCFTVSDKARSIAGGVVEALLMFEVAKGLE